MKIIVKQEEFRQALEKFKAVLKAAPLHYVGESGQEICYHVPGISPIQAPVGATSEPVNYEGFN